MHRLTLTASRLMPGALLLACVAMQAPAQEDERLLILDIKVEGTRVIAPETVLSEVTSTRVGDEYNPQKVEQDRAAILRLGYFENVEVRRTDRPGGVIITFVVTELQRITDIILIGNTVISDDELVEVMVTKEGHIADPDIMRADLQRIMDLYASKGYDAQIVSGALDEFGRWTIHISERKIKEIIVHGLKKTKKHVVMRELRVKPGDLFNENKVRDDIKRIYNLQIFEPPGWDITSDPDLPEEYVQLIINVKEKRTGIASFGGGYSSLDGLIGFVSVSENNLFGEGRRIGVDAQFGGRESWAVSYNDPWLDPHHTGLSLNVFNTERRRDFAGRVGGGLASRRGTVFDERRRGGSLAITRPIGRDLAAIFGFRAEDISDAFFQASKSIGTPVPGPGAFSVHPRQGELPGEPPDGGVGPGDALGPITVSSPLHRGGDVRSVILSGIQDTRDLITNPTKGGYHALSVETAGSLLGGGADFRKYTVEARRYVKISKKKDRVLAARVRAGTASDDTPLFEWFIAGGADTLRGYVEDRYWGENVLLTSVEVREPITKRLHGVLFVDAADAWGGESPTALPGLVVRPPDREFALHVGVGAGIRVDTPIGPLRFDWGFGEEGSRFHFGIGHPW
ncbi:MAG: outer membrane protein assembly factor [Armatimonadota bacterium]